MPWVDLADSNSILSEGTPMISDALGRTAETSTPNADKKTGGRKATAVAVTTALLLLGAVGCKSKADVASHNLSKAADQFEIQRRIVFFNGITDKYLLEIVGRCSLGNHDGPKELSVTCKIGPDQYEKHFLGLSDNVSYFVEQTEPAAVSVYRYRVLFRPTTIVPDITGD